MSHTHALIEAAVEAACQTRWPGHPVPSAVAPVKPGQSGDYATPAALALAKTLGVPACDLAAVLAAEVAIALPWLTAEVSGPGFVNFTVCPERLLAVLAKAAEADYGRRDGLSDILLEYGSANPTGPLHIGHARGLVVGSSLANLLRHAGHAVRTEYYVNDAGGQVEDLARSVLFRAREQAGLPQIDARPAYPGAYLAEAAAALNATHPAAVRAETPDLKPEGVIARFCVDWCLALIRRDLARLGTAFDAFVHESDIGPREAEAVFGPLRAAGHIGDGVLPALPGKPTGGPRPVFRSTQFGDDQDRALTRDDGSRTYFANDVLNHARKAGLTPHLITLLGEDHGGYVARIAGAVSALGATLETPLVRTVHLMRDGKPLSMSKRAGTFETVSDLLDAVPADAVRMSLLGRTQDSSIVFDLSAAAADGPKSPVWSVNYAHARLTSVLGKAPASGTPDGEMSPQERTVARLVTDWPRVLQSAAAAREPHRVAGFCRDLADAVNAWWSARNAEPGLRIVREADPDGTARRVRVARAAKAVLASGLRILGVTPADEMRAGDAKIHR